MENMHNYAESRSMRISWLVALLLMAAFSLFAQVTVNVDNQPIRQILKTIEKNSDYKFFYNDGFTALNQNASLNVTNVSIDQALKNLFGGSGVAWEKKENNLIVLTPEKNTPNADSKKSKGIVGVVTDEKGEAIIGANIMIKGTTVGTITDLDGKFKIDASEFATLVISYVGYTPQQKLVGKQSNITVKLVEDNKRLEEVVVIGYGSAKRKDLTTAVSTVSTKDIDQRPIISAAQAIQGKAAGVSVMQPSGEPGKGMVVRVRGTTSINASNDPLYVVDGVPMNEINFLSPNDIESMQILKDASSAAIYGSRAANGVVLITTKMGNKGEAKISFNAHTGTTNVVKQMKSLNTEQYKALMDEIGAVTLPSGLTDQTDWFKETFRTGVTEDYQLSVSNSSDKYRYFISGGLTNEKGIIPVAYFKRYNFRANLENQVRSWFKLTSNVSYSDYSSNGIISGTGANRAGVILSVINTPTYAPIWNPSIPTQYYDKFYGAQTTSPVENMSRTANDQSINNRFIGSGAGEISFTKDLKFRSQATIDRVYYNKSTFLDPIATAYGRSQHGNGSDTRSLSSILVFDNIMTFEKTIDKHGINLMGGSSYTKSDWSESNVTVSNFWNSDIKTLNAGNKVGIGDNVNYTNASQWAISSLVGRMAYNYNSKYLLTVNWRADGSSKLNPKHRWGYFPSASAAWRISSENFMKNIEWIDDLKLRGGWGKVGNQSGIGDYSYFNLLRINRVDWTGSANPNANANVTISPTSNMYNADLTWESTATSNIGLDLTLLKNRLTFAVDAYYKYTKDLLLTYQMPGSNGAIWVTRNQGEMSNKGIEFSLNSKNLTKKFKWETDMNISFNRNRIENFGFMNTPIYAGQTSVGENTSIIKPGLPIGTFYGYISKGVDPETGNLLYLTKDGKLTSSPQLSDRTIIGDPNPKFTYGITNNFTYIGFSLSLFLQGSYGNDIFNVSRMETEGMYDAKNQSVAVLDRWERPGMVTYMPKAIATKDNLKSSTRFIEDGSYIRLKTLSLSYSFKNSLLKKIGLGRLQPYLTAQNLFTITKYKGFDPEVSQSEGNPKEQGIDYGTYPQSKSYVVGINVEF
ncbi:MAG: SusC/RagA family TonB-linked outer membrane protein [Bacteroidales bacterium]